MVQYHVGTSKSVSPISLSSYHSFFSLPEILRKLIESGFFFKIVSLMDQTIQYLMKHSEMKST